MTLNEAYRILGVNPNATEQEIKKAYKTLSRKYHPDTNVNKPEKEQQEREEMFKNVGNAYDMVMKAKKFSHSNTASNVEETKKEEIKNIRTFLNELDKEENRTLLKKIYKTKYTDYIENLKETLFDIIDDIRECSTEEVAENKITFQILKIAFLKDIETKYFTQNHIFNEQTKRNYECSLTEFIEKLETEKYNVVTKRINKELEEYTLYAGYNALKEKIDEIKEKY